MLLLVAKPDIMSAIQNGNPPLAAAIRNEDIPAMQVRPMAGLV